MNKKKKTHTHTTNYIFKAKQWFDKIIAMFLMAANTHNKWLSAHERNKEKKDKDKQYNNWAYAKSYFKIVQIILELAAIHMKWNEMHSLRQLVSSTIDRNDNALHPNFLISFIYLIDIFDKFELFTLTWCKSMFVEFCDLIPKTTAQESLSFFSPWNFFLLFRINADR